MKANLRFSVLWAKKAPGRKAERLSW